MLTCCQQIWVSGPSLPEHSRNPWKCFPLRRSEEQAPTVGCGNFPAEGSPRSPASDFVQHLFQPASGLEESFTALAHCTNSPGSLLPQPVSDMVSAHGCLK